MDIYSTTKKKYRRGKKENLFQWKNHHNLHKYVNLIAFGFKLSHIVIIPITKNNKKSFSFAVDAF